MLNDSEKSTENIETILKATSEIYNDGLKSTLQESGKVLSLIPRTINAALLPLREWIAQREYKFAETQKLLVQKLEFVSETKIVTPKEYVAIPALLALSYSMSNEELQNLYATLLSKAMHKDYCEQVHPAYIEIIKQLSPVDIKLFEWIYRRPTQNILLPYCNLVKYQYNRRGKKSYRTSITYETNIVGQEFASHNIQSQALDNLFRLRLIAPSKELCCETKAYKEIQTSKEYTEALLSHPGVGELSPMYLTFASTELGISFFDTCACPIK